MKIVVTGTTGRLGSSLCPYLRQCGHTLLRLSRNSGYDILADLTDFRQVRQALDLAHADTIINLAALTDVDTCEKYPQDAYQANTRIVENLARWISESATGCHLVQISTDQVYDGAGPHKENEARLTNYYAFSKYAGELAALNVDATVLRTNFVGRSQCPGRKTLSDWLVDSCRAGAAISIFDDVWFAPMDIKELIHLIERTVQTRRAGVFNLGSREGMTKADFAERLARKLGLTTAKMQRRSIKDFNFLAYRPKDMRLDTGLFEETFNVRLATLQDVIERISQDYRHDH